MITTTLLLAWLACAAAAALYLVHELGKAPLLDEHEQPRQPAQIFTVSILYRPEQPARCTVSMLHRGHTIMIRYDTASAGELWPAIMRIVNLIEDESCVGK